MNYEWMEDEGVLGLRGKRVLIAGGSGFIGGRVVSALESIGCDVVVPTRRRMASRERVRYVQADLLSREALRGIAAGGRFDALLYLAAHIPLKGEPKEDYADAVGSTLAPFVNFCEAFAGRAGKLVYASSVDALGSVSRVGYDEGEPPCRPTPYGMAKYSGEQYASAICAREGVPLTVLRFAQVYGPMEPVVRVIPILARAISEGAAFRLHTTGEELRRFLYVDDAAQAVARAAASGREGVFNVAGDEVVSILDLIRTMERVWGRDLAVDAVGGLAGNSNVPSISSISGALGFRPEVSLEEGLGRVMRGCYDD